MKYSKYLFILFIIVVSISSNAQLRLSVESGYVTTQYNDVKVPNGDQAAGTLFSLSDDFKSGGSGTFIRVEAAYLIGQRHLVELTAAPLLVKYKDASLSDINFAGQTFTGANINGSYQFNTYRLSYRYRLLNRTKWTFDLGASLLARDARIAVIQNEKIADDTDLGFVPLVSFELNYQANKKLALTLKGDALVGPVGRAEDVFAGIKYNLWKEKLQLKAGYRIIEGGANVDQVYNFAFFHFADLGLVYTFK